MPVWLEPHKEIEARWAWKIGGCQIIQVIGNGFLIVLIVVQVQLSPFSAPAAPLTHHSYFPPMILTPFGFVHVSFIVVPENLPPLPHRYTLPPSLWLLLVLNWNVSGYILLACLLPYS